MICVKKPNTMTGEFDDGLGNKYITKCLGAAHLVASAGAIFAAAYLM